MLSKHHLTLFSEHHLILLLIQCTRNLHNSSSTNRLRPIPFRRGSLHTLKVLFCVSDRPPHTDRPRRLPRRTRRRIDRFDLLEEQGNDQGGEQTSRSFTTRKWIVCTKESSDRDLEGIGEGVRELQQVDVAE